MKQIIGILIVALASVAGASSALSSQVKHLNENQDGVIEFRRGDLVPISVVVEGGFVETAFADQIMVRVKRDFWLKLSAKSVEMSLDGKNFKSVSELASGSLSAGVDEQTDQPHIGLKLDEK